jgi:hypothetical protein
MRESWSGGETRDVRAGQRGVGGLCLEQAADGNCGRNPYFLFEYDGQTNQKKLTSTIVCLPSITHAGCTQAKSKVKVQNPNRNQP